MNPPPDRTFRHATIYIDTESTPALNDVTAKLTVHGVEVRRVAGSEVTFYPWHRVRKIVKL